MSRDYDEKRDYVRVEVDCEVFYNEPESQDKYHGQVKNLSGRGMMFVSERGIPEETLLEVQIAPKNDLTSPLHALVRVVRLAKQRHDNGYEIGAVIQQMLDE